MSKTYRTILFAVLVLAKAAFGQVSLETPKHFTSSRPIELRSVSRVALPHNTPAAIEQELLDPNTINLIAASTGLENKDLARVAVAPWGGQVWFYALGEPDKAWRVFGPKLQLYVQGRLDGHTKSFLLSTLTNRIVPERSIG